MSNVLEQATAAAEQRNWSLLNHCLQQLPLGKTATHPEVGASVVIEASAI
jgi:hypothetical protein